MSPPPLDLRLPRQLVEDLLGLRVSGVPAPQRLQAPLHRRVEVASDQVDRKGLKRWLAKARGTQWDCKNIVRRNGRLERLV